MSNLVYFGLRNTMRLLVRIVIGKRNLKVIGLENVPRRGGVLVIGNHIATVDPPLTGALLPRTDVHYMAKAESFGSGKTRWLFRAYHAFPVIRGSADRQALRHALKLLEDGHVLFVYPEGSRSTTAQLQRPHAGVGFLAKQSGAAVVPVAISGSENVLPKGSKWPKRQRVSVRFGMPFHAHELADAQQRLSSQQLADRMMWRVADLLPAEYRGVFSSDEAVSAAAPPNV